MISHFHTWEEETPDGWVGWLRSVHEISTPDGDHHRKDPRCRRTKAYPTREEAIAGVRRLAEYLTRGGGAPLVDHNQEPNREDGR